MQASPVAEKSVRLVLTIFQRLLQALVFLPFVGWMISFAASIWMLIAMVVAVRQALDYHSTARAVVVCLIGFVIYVGIQVSVGVVLVLTGLAGVAGAGA